MFNLPDLSGISDAANKLENFGKECLTELRAINAKLDILISQNPTTDEGKSHD